MFDHPWWLAALALLPVVRWLHRYRAAVGATPVAAAFLWRSDLHTGVRGREPQPPDPAWRRRAGVVALLVLALAGPRLPGGHGAPVIVWLDNSQSVYARDVQGTRMAHAMHELGVALDAARPAQVQLRSLADPAASLDVSGMPAAERDRAIGNWTRAPRGEPRLPLPVALDAQHEHWLVTDGADAQIARWAGTARLARIVQAGTGCTNAAVTLLALRAPIAGDAPLEGLVEVTNACAAPAQRRLQVRVGTKLVLDEFLALAPDARVQRSFPAAQYTRVRAELAGGDPLPLDDALTVDGAKLRPVPTRIVGACPASIEAAVRAHPRLQVTTGQPALAVVCGDAGALPPGVLRVRLAAGDQTFPVQGPLAWIDAGPLASLALDPAWLRRAEGAPKGTPLLTDGTQPLIARNSAGVDTALALGLPPFDSRPEQAALLAGLIDAATGRELLGETTRASLAPGAARIAPLPLPAAHAAPSFLASTRPAASVLLGAALLLLLYDLVRTPGTTARLARAAVALLCLLAWWNPANPLRKAPIDLGLLLDESGSMPEHADAEAWDSVRAQALPSGSRVTVTRFGAAPADEGSFDASALPAQMPARFAVDATRTNVADAIAQALREGDPERERVLLLASDAEENAGDAEPVLAQARAAGVTVLLRAPEGGAGASAAIEDVEIPANAAVERRVPLAVCVTAPETLTLEVDDDGRSERVPVAHGTRTWQLWLEASAERERTIALRLLAADGGVLDERVEPVALAGPATVLLVTRASASNIADSLEAGGHRVTLAAPGGMQQALDEAGAADVVILDDIAVDEASAAGWDALARAVHGGTGLAVLGGAHSFMAGQYRDATIETLLPVLSAPPREQAPAAVLFVIDKSGSMGRETTIGATRFELARQAVLATAQALPASDLVGLLAFDVAPTLVRPITPGGGRSIETSWTFAASGGTALAPALDAAITALAAAPPEQRLLVLATDGFVVDESLDPLIARLASAHIDVIALAIGDEPDLAVLSRLAAVNHGALERVTDVATLPRLMSTELASRRASVERGSITPVQRAELPFFTAQAWPSPDAYAVTTARPEARVALVSAAGDPLIALDESGAGRVVVLTAGLGEWARAWQSWPQSPALLGGLVDWLGARSSANLHARVVERAGAAALEIDAAADDHWRTLPAARVSWLDPANGVSVVAADVVAPGRYGASPPVAGPGGYRAVVDLDGERTTARYTRAANLEQHPSEAARGARERWIAQGLVQPWPDGLAAARHAQGSLRAVLLAVALAGFLAALLVASGRLSRRQTSRDDDGATITART